MTSCVGVAELVASVSVGPVKVAFGLLLESVADKRFEQSFLLSSFRYIAVVTCKYGLDICVTGNSHYIS